MQGRHAVFRSRAATASPSAHSDLGRVGAIGKVGDHVDAHALLGELHKRLILVGPDIELGLDNGAKRRAQLPQLFLGGFIGQVSDVQHLWESEKGRLRNLTRQCSRVGQRGGAS